MCAGLYAPQAAVEPAGAGEALATGVEPNPQHLTCVCDVCQHACRPIRAAGCGGRSRRVWIQTTEP